MGKKHEQAFNKEETRMTKNIRSDAQLYLKFSLLGVFSRETVPKRKTGVFAPVQFEEWISCGIVI